jgi:hypothetical protein
MFKPLMLAAAASLALGACATRPEPVRTVFINSSQGHHAFHAPRGAHGGSNVVILRNRDGRGPLIINGQRIDGRRLALAPLEPEALAQLRRDAEAMGAHARRMGELARKQGETARLQGETARAQGEAARAQGAEIRREAQRLRELCERGQVRCEIIITD